MLSVRECVGPYNIPLMRCVCAGMVYMDDRRLRSQIFAWKEYTYTYTHCEVMDTLLYIYKFCQTQNKLGYWSALSREINNYNFVKRRNRELSLRGW